jgi:hypothetical protein
MTRRTCPTCHGAGTVDKDHPPRREICPSCNGAGVVDVSAALSLPDAGALMLAILLVAALLSVFFATGLACGGRC